jgi:CBS domain-containing protein
VVGIVTEYDLILAVATVGHGLDIDHIMKKEVVTISDKTPVDEIMDIILTKRLKSFPILDAGGKLVGVVSRRDVLTELSTSA